MTGFYRIHHCVAGPRFLKPLRAADHLESDIIAGGRSPVRHPSPSYSRRDMAMQPSERIDNLVANLADWRGTTFANIRRIIHEADPEIVEEWKWMGTPVWSHDGIVCVANAFKDKVKVTFYDGAHLADPDKLFNNGLEGKQWRTIDIYKDDKINESSLKTLINAAVDHNTAKLKSTNRSSGTRGNLKKKPAV
jgi:hypothetical protein